MASFNSDDNDENHFTDESDTAVIRLPKAKAKAPPTSTTVPKRKPRGRQGSDAKDQKAKESDSFNYEIGIDLTLPPISKNSEIFADMLGKALDNGLVEALRHLGKRKLRVATMCSDLKSRNLGLDFGIDHVFSAEIVVFKQAYIERNFSPPIIFKDIRELGVDGATTA
ncbi:MAG: hypothetical protein M1818_002745 [Claussenomyces sp. TS43310]|nr:MAG: hypothetical protein M1818_002745 [Claussenomyces sp. TS43310]